MNSQFTYHIFFEKLAKWLCCHWSLNDCACYYPIHCEEASTHQLTSMDEHLPSLCSSSHFCSASTMPMSLLIFWGLIEESKLLLSVFSNTINVGHSFVFTVFCCNLLQLFYRVSGMSKLPKNCGVVDRYEVVLHRRSASSSKNQSGRWWTRCSKYWRSSNTRRQGQPRSPYVCLITSPVALQSLRTR